jgi:hypothetical protein
MVAIPAVFGSLGACRCNLGLLAEKAALVMPDGSDKTRSWRDAMVVAQSPDLKQVDECGVVKAG